MNSMLAKAANLVSDEKLTFEEQSGFNKSIPVPLTTLTTPGGKPTLERMSSAIEVASGVSSLGLITQVHPEARMGPSL